MDQEKSSQFYEEYEVFSKRNQMAPFQHQFSLLAPNREMAMMMAKENFLRREPCVNIWVVKRSDIAGLGEDERQVLTRLDNKKYRETAGYGYLKKKWRQYEQEQFTEKNLLKES
ncbi:1,2-phenylacetyl-CoA epoxidase subunit PaaB [Alteribacter natronophilus]|uniref:1,2-phenylacetyl-CoA epoxidase subunit PaaB n=1 Tax=Alteribacter natronophilus TaxID=2583810 RepID=UPI00110D2FD7|nr:1,2-phenylacetyl-CoA epoxidase subunit PaaB [Alteribacter natronophilus]TMW73056.1 1,2-phenylacetyl-CoA epoxidase subunit B [Alteribacter natronophilus]